MLTLPSIDVLGRLEHLAILLDQPVGVLLVKQRDAFLKPLLARRLRALPVLTQVGYVEAVGYYLKQQGGCIDVAEGSTSTSEVWRFHAVAGE